MEVFLTKQGQTFHRTKLNTTLVLVAISFPVISVTLFPKFTQDSRVTRMLYIEVNLSVCIFLFPSLFISLYFFFVYLSLVCLCFSLSVLYVSVCLYFSLYHFHLFLFPLPLSFFLPLFLSKINQTSWTHSIFTVQEL